MRRSYSKKALFIAVISLVLCLTAFYAPVRAEEGEYAYIGGEIVGFEADVGGVLVTSAGEFDSGEWSVKSAFLPGDVIVSVNGYRVKKAEDITDILSADDFPKNNVVKVRILRNGKELEEDVTTGFDGNGNKRMLGVTVKDCVCGLGTITFIKKDGTFAALGHGIADCDTGHIIDSQGGRLVCAHLSGISLGTRGRPGTIKGYLSNKGVGMIEKSGRFGLIGKTTVPCDEGRFTAKLGGRKDVNIGSAKICSCVSGKKEFYDVKIVKAFPQRESAEKSMIIRVSDGRLINLTGGIVQGMSGSPIIQNGVIVGAVTHVFTSDSTMGFGVYADWLC